VLLSSQAYNRCQTYKRIIKTSPESGQQNGSRDNTLKANSSSPIRTSRAQILAS
jgi:hypothetical protein